MASVLVSVMKVAMDTESSVSYGGMNVGGCECVRVYGWGREDKSCNNATASSVSQMQLIPFTMQPMTCVPSCPVCLHESRISLTLSSCILAASRNCCLATAFLAQLSTLSVYTSSSNADCCCVETEGTTRVLKPHSILSTSSCDIFSRNFSSNVVPSKGGTCTCSVVVEGLALGVCARETPKDDILP